MEQQQRQRACCSGRCRQLSSTASRLYGQCGHVPVHLRCTIVHFTHGSSMNYPCIIHRPPSSFAVQSYAYRPNQCTSIANAFIAGDWVKDVPHGANGLSQERAYVTGWLGYSGEGHPTLKIFRPRRGWDLPERPLAQPREGVCHRRAWGKCARDNRCACVARPLDLGEHQWAESQLCY